MPKTNSICLTPLLPPLSLSDCSAEQRRNEIRHVKKKHLCMPPLFVVAFFFTHTLTQAHLFRGFHKFLYIDCGCCCCCCSHDPPWVRQQLKFRLWLRLHISLAHTHTLARCFRITFLYTFFENIYRKRQTKKKNYRRELFVGCWPFCMTSCGMRLRWAKRLRRGSFRSEQ